VDTGIPLRWIADVISANRRTRTTVDQSAALVAHESTPTLTTLGLTGSRRTVSGAIRVSLPYAELAYRISAHAGTRPAVYIAALAVRHQTAAKPAVARYRGKSIARRGRLSDTRQEEAQNKKSRVDHSDLHDSHDTTTSATTCLPT